jgi:hypothetical protein
MTKTTTESAQTRVDVKRAIRKEVCKIEGQNGACALVMTSLRNELHEDDYLSENLYRIAFKYSSNAEYANTEEEKTVFLQARDIIKSLISWLKYQEKLVEAWDENALEIRKCNKAKTDIS